MAKEKSSSKLSKEEKRALKASSASAASHSTPAVATVDESSIKKSKSDKKEKKDKKDKKSREVLAEKALNEIQTNAAGEPKSDVDSDVEMEDVKEKTKTRPIGALVPFANPLADEKVGKKVFKCVKKAAANRTLKRGVKEVVKSLRKSPTTLPPSSISTGTTSTTLPLGIVVLAADISPLDVISHIPVLCEDHNIPYIYVSSRAELGMAGMTKRPTSVVMVARDGAKKGDKKEGEKVEDGEAWEESYKGLVKVVEREGRNVRV